MPICQILLLAEKSSQQFLDATILKLPSKKLVHAIRFGKLAFFTIFMLYFNILSSKVLVHWVEPIARFSHGVWFRGQNQLLFWNCFFPKLCFQIFWALCAESEWKTRNSSNCFENHIRDFIGVFLLLSFKGWSQILFLFL